MALDFLSGCIDVFGPTSGVALSWCAVLWHHAVTVDLRSVAVLGYSHLLGLLAEADCAPGLQLWVLPPAPLALSHCVTFLEGALKYLFRGSDT